MFTCDGNHTWGKCDRDDCDFERLLVVEDEPEDPIELDLSSCPYYQGTGTCFAGCVTEPSCITDEPLEGWPSKHTASKAGSLQ